MRIAFIYPPKSHRRFAEDIDVVDREFGVFPPLGLAYAAAINEKARNQSIIIDVNATNLSKKEVLAQIKKWEPDMLGFMLTAYGFFDTLNWIRFLKSATGLPILAGNFLCTFYPEIIMQYREIDYIIVGPATDSLPQLLKRLENGESLHGLLGVGWRDNDKIVISKLKSMKEDFTRLPFPARHLLPNEKYHAVMSKRKFYTIMITSKGCNANCTFCHIHGIPFSFRPEEMVVAEMEECFHKYKIREMDIFDPSFTMLRNRVLKICEGIVKKNIDIHWACRARVDQVDDELLRNMQKAGCRRILYGIESGVDNNLRKMKKGIIIDQAKKAVNMTKKSGIMAIGFFMLGIPGETVETIRKTIEYSLEIGVDYAQYHRTIAKPFTELNRQMNEALGYDYWREYISGRIPEIRLPAPWTEIPEYIIQKTTKYAYFRFYFRPKYLFRLISRIKSWDEFKRYVRSALGLLLSRADK